MKKLAGDQSIDFRANARRALQNPTLRKAMRHATESFRKKRNDAIVGIPFEEWREQASELRKRVIGDISGYVDEFAANATKRGAIVHRARTAEGARDLISSILKDNGVKTIVKSKSMVTEEIHLNKHLADLGFRVVETDLGEYIIQIAGETPSHIIVPAIHRSREQIGQLFCEKLGCDFSDDPAILTDTARKLLRQEFLTADAAISGANCYIADTGSIVLFTNEGNGRMVTNFPPLHIAVTSIEKALPSFKDLPLIMRILPRSATGQVLTSYLSIISGQRRPDSATDTKKLHIVLLDNGRSRVADSPYREILKCIKCGACMNVCPVYGMIGGHAYASTYPGPMGVILSTLLNGLENAHPLLDATTLCGACAEACPVKVPLLKLLYELREMRVAAGHTDTIEAVGMKGFGIAAKSPQFFQMAQASLKTLWPLGGLLAPVTVNRLPKPVTRTFRRRFS
ncbi:MAG: LutB/LldF family L-lactate oxidation iron-sulfur protein [Desulfomonilaceae bacterium]